MSTRHALDDPLLDRLVGSILTRLNDAAASSVSVPTGVHLLDVQDPTPVPTGSVVVLTGVDDAARLTDVLAGTMGASAVVVRSSLVDGPIADVIRGVSMPAYGLIPGISVLQLAGMLDAGVGDESRSADAPPDLYDLAESLAAVLGSAITVEDPASRVLAFSRDQASTDEYRRQTILGMRVPDDPLLRPAFRDALARVARSERPVRVDELSGVEPRWAIPITAGTEVLGSIWAVESGPLTAAQSRAFVESAHLAGLAITRSRIAADAEAAGQAAAMSDLLAGGARARVAANRLGLQHDPALVVAVCADRVTGDDVAALAECARRTHDLRAHLRTVAPRAVVALFAQVTYVVAPVAGDDAERALLAMLDVFLERYRGETGLVAGVGLTVPDHAELNESRAEAESIIRVLFEPGSRRRRASAEEVWAQSAVLTISDALSPTRRRLLPPLARLARYDHEHGATLVPTLRAYLESFGDAAGAARALGVHVNTLRYRLGRIESLGGVDLRDADLRLALQLQLRMPESRETRRR